MSTIPDSTIGGNTRPWIKPSEATRNEQEKAALNGQAQEDWEDLGASIGEAIDSLKRAQMHWANSREDEHAPQKMWDEIQEAVGYFYDVADLNRGDR